MVLLIFLIVLVTQTAQGVRYLENRYRCRLQGSCLAFSGCLASHDLRTLSNLLPFVFPHYRSNFRVAFSIKGYRLVECIRFGCLFPVGL